MRGDDSCSTGKSAPSENPSSRRGDRSGTSGDVIFLSNGKCSTHRANNEGAFRGTAIEIEEFDAYPIASEAELGAL
jgi:hypothetical protein